MKNLLNYSDHVSASANSIITFGQGILLAVFLSYILSKLCNVIHKANPLTITFKKTLLVLPIIVMCIIFFVGSSLTLSIGLLGSLSIIRFRTAVKSPYELILLLISIMIGIGLGSQNFIITVLATLVIYIFIYTLETRNVFSNKDDAKVLVHIQTELDFVTEIKSFFTSNTIIYSFESISRNLDGRHYLLSVDSNELDLEKLESWLSSVALCYRISGK